MRELILELAVRGKLVPQDPDDEPASELLKRIQAEKTELIATGKIKKDKPLPPIADEDKPFDVPPGWEWVRLGDIAETIRGVTYGKSDASDNPLPDYVPLLRGNNINRFLNFDSPVFVPKQLLNEAQYVKAGDMVIAMSSGSADLVGKAAQATEDFDGGFGAFCGVVRSVSAEIHGFFGFFFQTPLYRIRAAGHGKGIGINNLQKTALQTLEIPLPPLAEQHRIVAKVDELMALCGQLEQQQTHSIEAHQTLVETLLGTLVRPELRACRAVEGRASTSSARTEFEEAWTRIANHFDTLFTTEHSIDQLKQTILQLAVMGKLVPQDPNNEPASVLLEKIAKERDRLHMEGQIKRQKELPEPRKDQKPFSLPKGWSWVALSQLGVFSGGKTPSKMKGAYWDGDIPWVTPKDMKVLQISDTEDHVTEDAVNDGLELYEPESVLFVVRSGILRRTFPVAVAKVRCTVNQDLKVLSLFDKASAAYVLVMMRGFERYILQNLTKTGMTVESVLFDEFAAHYFMVPPLAEQHRIVAKVDELMALCDALKARVKDAQTTQIHLADAIVEQAVA